MKRSVPFLLIAAIAASAGLAACGRNPGAKVREDALAAAKPKCVPFEPGRLRGAAVIAGKEKFQTERKGAFVLESFRVSQVFDRLDRKVSSSVFHVTDFEDAASRAPRLAIDPECLDLKDEGLDLDFSPITRIDSATGLALEAQPLKLEVAANGRMRARTTEPTPSTQSLPAGKLPEAALLLGASHAGALKTLSFRVKEAEDGSLTIAAEFAGIDANLSRLFVKVEAVYGWEAAE